MVKDLPFRALISEGVFGLMPWGTQHGKLSLASGLNLALHPPAVLTDP